MHDVLLDHKTLPRHVDMARSRNGLPLVEYRGDASERTVKFAQWRGQLQDVHTTPRDDYHTICYHESGATVRRKGSGGLLTPGTVFLQAANDEGVFDSDGALDYVHLYVPIDTVQELADEFETIKTQTAEIPIEFGCRDREWTQALAVQIGTIRDTANPTAIEFDEWTLDIGMALLRYAARTEDKAFAVTAKSSLTPQQMRDVVDFIEERIATRISLADLAGLSGISQFRFMRAFKAETGFNPHQYVIERRVARAKSLLQYTDDSIADIAYDIGFSSQAHMTDVFRKRVGATPGQFRRIMTG